jgi:plastocyanin
MTSSLTSSPGRTDLMFGSLLPHRKDTARRVSVLYPLLKQLNTGTLAFAMFVAVALLSSTHGKDSETRASAPVKAIKTEVAIDNFSSSTNTLTLPARATVTWTNHDNVLHVVASADNQFQKSAGLKSGQSFSHTFVTTGTYSYFCSIHPRMTEQLSSSKHQPTPTT